MNQTDFEIELGKFFSELSQKNINVTVYTNEFDLSMFKIFFPTIESSLFYLDNSISFVDKINEDILLYHPITIVRDGIIEFEDKIEKVEQKGAYLILYTKKEFLKVKKIKETNELIECSYVCTLFPSKDGVDLNKLKITTIGEYSITSYTSNKEIIKLIEEQVGKNITILDGTSGVGGDTIGFALNFKKVISIEKDELNFEALSNNVDVYKLSNVELYNRDFTIDGYNIIETEKPDVVFFDPPWLGRDYKKYKTMDLFLNNINIVDIIKNIVDNYKFIKLIVLKVPINYNFSKLNNIEKHYNIHKLKKFDVVLIYNK